MPVIGVVGGIGSGKSEVAAAFEGFGGFVIDADKVGHALLTQRPVIEEVVEAFGPAVVVTGDDGERAIDRRALGAIVFRDTRELKRLEAILHPRMRSTFTKAVARTGRRGRHKAVVLDAAVLFETGWDNLCDRIIFVDAPREQRLARVESSRGWSDEELARREAAQMPLDEKQAKATAVILNQGDLEELKTKAERTWDAILASPPPRVRPAPALGPSREPQARPGRRLP